MIDVTFPLDHFGIVAGPLFQALLNQSGDRRKRKTAFNALTRIAKNFGCVPKNASVKYIGLVVDSAGQIVYQIRYVEENPHGHSAPIV